MKRARSTEAQISELHRLDPEDLKSRYRRWYGDSAPADLSPDLLIALVGYRLQKQLIADLRLRMSQALTAGEAIVSALSTGLWVTVLIRQWRGHCHVVTLLDDAVVYQGRQYRSLDAVARRITGGKVKAEAFFDLEERPKKAASGDHHAQP